MKLRHLQEYLLFYLADVMEIIRVTISVKSVDYNVYIYDR